METKLTLKAARVNANYRIEDVAPILMVTPGTISNWERGKAIPRADKLFELCNLYGVSRDSIILSTNSAES